MRRALAAALVGALLATACDAVRIPGRGNDQPDDRGANDGPPPPPPDEPVPGHSVELPSDSEPDDGAPAPDTPEPSDPAPEPEPVTDPAPAEPDPATLDPEPAPSEPEPDPAPIADPEPEPAPAEPEPEPAPIEPEPEPVEPTFSYHPAGVLLAGSGAGSPDRTVFAPDMVFPIQDAFAYPQSQVWNFGGGVGGGDECDPRNYEYPWRDNFCETRSSRFSTPFCPISGVHLGQDIRVGTPQGCEQLRRTSSADRRLYAVVAAEDGVISNIGRYTVNVRAGSRIYRYLHMNMQALEVELNEQVEAGQVIGYVSKDFGGTPTTFHLHFEIKVNTAEHGWAFVPPYTSLVASYERREGGPGEEVPQNVAVASTPLPIPEGAVITEGFVSERTSSGE
ncbi:MAG: peptidoglycan DD-metalloendopeptidase family protein [Pseudomonadota bacterium]